MRLVGAGNGIVVLNRCPAGRVFGEATIVTEARRALEVYGIPISPVSITQRASFQYALAIGQGITEYEPLGKGADEIRKLWEVLK